MRSTIILPGRWIKTGSGDSLEAILAHELAHARRLDHLVNLAQRAVEMMLFFHPAVHWLSRSLRRQREFCADALAVRLTGDSLALALALESVARLRFSRASAPRGASYLGGQPTSLLPRIQELLGMKPSRIRAGIWPFVALAASGLAGVVATSASLAQDRPRLDTVTPAIASTAAVATDEAASRIPGRLQVAYQSRRADQNREIIYEIKILTGKANRLRRYLGEGLELAKQEGDCTSWIIDGKTLSTWLRRAQDDVETNILQAPKITSPDNGYAFASTGQRYSLSKTGTGDNVQSFGLEKPSASNLARMARSRFSRRSL